MEMVAFQQLVIDELKSIKDMLSAKTTAAPTLDLFNPGDRLMNVSTTAERIFEHFGMNDVETWKMTNFFTARLKYYGYLGNAGKDTEGKLYTVTEKTRSLTPMVIKDPYLPKFHTSNIGFDESRLSVLYMMWADEIAFKRAFDDYVAFIEGERND